MRKPQGYGITIEPPSATSPGSTLEEDSFTCCHCNAVVFVKPRQDPSEAGGFCGLCHSHICPHCAGTGACDPFERKLLRMESRERLLLALGA